MMLILAYAFVALLSSMDSVPIGVKHPPLMVKQPPASEELLFQEAPDYTVEEKPFVLECEADADPAPNYEWTKDGKEFVSVSQNGTIQFSNSIKRHLTVDGKYITAVSRRVSQRPGSGTLVFISPREEDSGQYQCFARNELGVARSNSVFVRKSVLNNFKAEKPRSIYVNEGDPIGLSCQAPDGYPKPLIHWIIQDDRGSVRTINSTRMTVDPEGTLWFSYVIDSDRSSDILYACSANSSFRNEYKLGNKVFLIVQSTGNSVEQKIHPPQQQFVSRKNTVILKGKDLRLWCIYSGKPVPQIEWMKQGGSLPIDRVDYENYGKTLVVRDVNLSDAGTYRCRVKNGVGPEASYKMNVEVQAIPEFTIEPEIQNKIEGETAIFRCNATGKPEPKIQWFYNGWPIEQAPLQVNREIHSNMIIISNLSTTDTGNYGCNATNQHGYVYKEAYVNVLALHPDIQVPPSNAQTVEGKDVHMNCRAFGVPKPRVSWTRDGHELSGGRYSITKDGDLIISKVSFNDQGTYVCTASNKFGKQISKGSLEVKKKTEIIDPPKDEVVEAGRFTGFRCHVVTDPSLSLSVIWKKDNKTIDLLEEPHIILNNYNALTIIQTTKFDSGVYTCVASTELDEVSKSATLFVQDVPNPPQLTNVTCNNMYAIIQWKSMGDNSVPILGYKIQYSTSFIPNSWLYESQDYPATTLQAKVPMSPWANYTFRVIASNKLGDSRPSDSSIVCTSPEDVPHKNPDGVHGKGSTPSNMVIKWSPMPEVDHNGRGFKYRVYWRRADVPNTAWESAEISDWKKDYYIIEGQPMFKPYRIKVEAHNDNGQAQVEAVEVLGYSGEDVPSEAPTNLTVPSIINSTTASLSWQPVSNASINGHFMGYKIQTWTEKDGEWKGREVVVENLNEQHTVVNSFIPDVKNFVRVLAFNGAYDGPSSQNIDFDMPEGTPGPVRSLRAVSLGSSGFLLRWDKPKEINGVLRGYNIYYQEVNDSIVGPISERVPHVSNPHSFSAKLAPLKPGTKYRLIVRGRTNAGIGEASSIELRTGKPYSEAPSRPSFLWQQVESENGLPAIKITWIPNHWNAGSHFYVQYKRLGELHWESTEHELKEDYLVLEMEAGLYFEMRIVSVHGDFSTPSDTEEIDTYYSKK